MTAIGTYADKSTANVTSTVQWQSLNSSIASVGEAGLVVGEITGSTSITVTLNGITGSASLTVVSPISPPSMFGHFIYTASFPDTGPTPSATTINGFSINGATGALTAIPGTPASVPDEVTTIAVHPSGNFLYVGTTSNTEFHIAALKVTSLTGELTPVAGSPYPLGTRSYGLATFETMALDPAGKFLYVTNNYTRTVNGYAVNASTGALTPLSQTPVLGDYYLAMSPGGDFLYAGNPDSEKTIVYSVDPSSGELTQVQDSSDCTGIEMTIDPTMRFLYDVTQPGTGVSACQIDPSSGLLTNTLSGSPFSPKLTFSGPVVHPLDAFLYADGGSSESAPQSLYGFSIDAATGVLTPMQNAPIATNGQQTPSIVIEPRGYYAYAAEDPGGIQSFTINQTTGELSQLSNSPQGPAADLIAIVGSQTPWSPGLTWSAPAAIEYGTALSSTQLNATADVAGTFSYSPAEGTVLGTGPHVLTVAFTPTDIADFTTATTTVSLTVNKASQTITFPTIPATPLLTGSATLAATASSGLPVSYEAVTAKLCSISGNTVTLLAAGDCVIAASQLGNADYKSATSVDQTFAITLTAQTITFAALPNRTYGATPFTVSATASSGLAVSFASTNSLICTVSGTSVTLVAGGGICTIEATQAGNTDYAPASAVTRSFTVNKEVQTITFKALPTQTYGAAPFTLTATATSGLPVSLASTTSSTCSVSGDTVTLLAGGGYCTIEATQAGNSDYSAASPISESFWVYREAQTITFATPPAQSYGATPTLSASASSGLPVSFASNTTSICTVSGNTATMVSVGTCTIEASQAGNGAYLAATGITRNFTVVKATQTITFKALPSQTYGAAPFALNATASSGLTVNLASTTTTVCTVSGTTLTLVGAGGYCTIEATQSGNADYNVASSISESFWVYREAQTVTFSALPAQTYGETPFTVSATASSGLAVSFASTTPSVCTVLGSTVTLLAGNATCTVQATQAGNGDFLAATPVSQSFKINPASQTITFMALSTQTYGAAPLTLNATSSSGLTVSFASTTSSICTVSDSTVTLVAGAGYCTIQAMQAGNSDYYAAPTITRSFWVYRQTQTITFSAPPTTAFSAGSVNLSASASSGLSVSFASTTSAVCTVSGTTATLVSAGTCTIQATQAGNNLYNPAPTITRNFTVTLN